MHICKTSKQKTCYQCHSRNSLGFRHFPLCASPHTIKAGINREGLELKCTFHYYLCTHWLMLGVEVITEWRGRDLPICVLCCRLQTSSSVSWPKESSVFIITQFAISQQLCQSLRRSYWYTCTYDLTCHTCTCIVHVHANQWSDTTYTCACTCVSYTMTMYMYMYTHNGLYIPQELALRSLSEH